MAHINILFLTIFSNLYIYIKGINIENDEFYEYPKEIKHGILNKDSWTNRKSYEYYIDIKDYKINEENIFELYTSDLSLIIYSNIFTLLTNATEEEIKNYSVQPKDIYFQKEDSFKLDPLTNEIYFYMPFKKTSINQNYFVILINIFYEGSYNQDIFYSISKRIPTIILNQNGNNNQIFFESLESRNDIHLYYKFEIGKNINLKENNIFFFVNETQGAIFSTNLSSLITYDNQIFILEKNNNEDVSEIYLGLKSLVNKTINITINLDKNDFYLLNGRARIDQKIYIEKLNCDNKFYIIENYYESFEEKMQKFLIINKLYGNFSLKYYNSFKSINFDEFSKEDNEIEILESVVSIEGKLNIYILSCVTPTAFIFEFFSNLSDHNPNLDEGKEIKAFLYPNQEYKLKIKVWENYKKYEFYISLLNDNRNISQELNGYFKYKQNTFNLNNNENKLNKMIYYGDESEISINSEKGAFVHFYLTSNLFFYNIIEGQTIVDQDEKKNLVLKIKNNLLFDSITLEAETESNSFKIQSYYEIKLLNKEVVQQNNKILAPSPGISIPKTNAIKLNFSNPYNKFDYPDDYDTNENDFYLFISFSKIDTNDPIYINIKYNYNEQIKSLSQIKSEIINLESEYEIYGNKDYINKSKILFNINKCNCSKNYSFINYYENNDTIITKNNITKNREIILVNNLYFNTKMKINSISNNERNDNNINYFPADYYVNGDIYLNYFLVDEKIFDQLKITNNFEINYEDKMRSKTSLSWNEYVILNNNHHIATNYSIYILPKDSIINSICQLSLIPSNKSIINLTEIEIDLEEGEYRVAIIATVIDEQFPIVNMYNILNIEVSKRLNITLIVYLSVFGFIIILLILFFLFRKKRKFLFFKRKKTKFSSQIEGNKQNQKKCNEKLEEVNYLDEKKELKNEINNNDIENEDLSENLIGDDGVDLKNYKKDDKDLIKDNN